MNGRDGRREEGKEAGREVASQVRAREHDGMDPKGKVKDFSFHHPKNNSKLVEVLSRANGEMIKYVFQKDANGFSMLSLLLKIAWEGKARLVLGLV